MMIPFDRATHCCTVHYTNCYFAYSLLCRAVKCPQIFVNKGRSHTGQAPSEWLNCWPFSDRKSLSLLIVIRNGAETYLYKAMNLELCWLLATCFFFSVCKMEATCSSYTSVDFHRTARLCIPEDRTLQVQSSTQCQHVLFRFRHGTRRSVIQLTSRSKVAAHQLFNSQSFAW
jgi:hypothetical protein